MPDNLVKKIDEISRLEDMNRSSLIRKLARSYISTFEKDEVGNDGFLGKMGRLVGK
jgi:metal-responsive CopG/Arc/MetJ family transcriptional regulator